MKKSLVFVMTGNVRHVKSHSSLQSERSSCEKVARINFVMIRNVSSCEMTIVFVMIVKGSSRKMSLVLLIRIFVM